MSLQTRTVNPRHLSSVRSDYSVKADTDLVLLCQKQDSAAFRELVKRHERTVYAFLYKLAPDHADPADMAQEVFIRIWRGIHKLQNPRVFKAWLRQIVTNIFYDELRKRVRQPSMTSLDEPFDNGEDRDTGTRDLPDCAPGPAELCLGKELRTHVQQALTTLPINYRMAVELRDIKGCSYDEIATLTKVELGTVKSRIARGRAQVQSILTPYLDSEDLSLVA
jgi:RNA polymerase sigma-70 factor, ECF subfamily